MNKQACLYCITNNIDGMQYIGVTTDLKRRFNAHARHSIKSKSIIKSSIIKYGKENFSIEVLVVGSQEYCYLLEQAAIDLYNTKTPSGYNICSGGRGAIGLLGKFNGMYGKRGELHPHYGKPGYSIGLKASAETKTKMRLAHLGKKRSAETKEKIRQVALSRSPELLQKMKEARAASKKQKSEVV